MKVIFFIFTLAILSSCLKPSLKIKDPLSDKSNIENSIPISISSVQISADNKLIISGANLGGVTSLLLTDNSGYTKNLTIESQTYNVIEAKSASSLTVMVKTILNLLVTNAYGAVEI